MDNGPGAAVARMLTKTLQSKPSIPLDDMLVGGDLVSRRLSPGGE